MVSLIPQHVSTDPSKVKEEQHKIVVFMFILTERIRIPTQKNDFTIKMLTKQGSSHGRQPTFPPVTIVEINKKGIQ